MAAINVHESVTINCPVETVYAFWRNFENLPKFMEHLRSVAVLDNSRSHWVAKAPLGTSVEWDAIVTEEQPFERIAWRSVEGADVDNSGFVSFNPTSDGRACVINVRLVYDPPAGALGAAVAKLFGEEPSQQIREDLRKLKQVLETGEMATIKGQPSGRDMDNLNRTA